VDHGRSQAELHAIAGDDRAVEELARDQQRFRLAFEHNMTGTIFIYLDGRILDANDAYCQIVGRDRDEIVGTSLERFTHPDDYALTEETRRLLVAGEADQITYRKRYLRGNGQIVDVEVSKAPARDAAGSTLCFVASVRDVTEERALHARLSHQALHDQLTGLANRVLFEDRLSQAHARTARRGGWGAVILLDLDDFKSVNDTLGHHSGDELLVAVARRLEKVTRFSDTLCRFGGDEFLYLAETLASPIQAEEVAERLLGVFAEPVSLSWVEREQHASIGVVVFDGTRKDCTEVIQDADAAMYEAKRRGKNRYVVFTPDMRKHSVSPGVPAQELDKALESGELSMDYQPLLDFVTLEVIGFEALMRWQHPDRGLIRPNVFIALAEQGDLIFKLGSFAIRAAAAEAKSWERTGTPASWPFVSVNLSARQFHDPDLLSAIGEALAASGLAPQRLLLEITENVALADVVETKRIIERLRHIGVAVALDDFGTGYASLSYLTLLEPMIVKIDQSLISPSLENAYNDTLLEAVVSLGRKLDMTLLAEGIETQAQLQRLRRLRCEIGQGYLFSPPVPPTKVADMLGKRHWAAAAGTSAGRRRPAAQSRA